MTTHAQKAQKTKSTRRRRPRSAFLVTYGQQSAPVRSTTALNAVKQICPPPAGYRWSAASHSWTIARSAIVRSRGRIVGRFVLVETKRRTPQRSTS